MNNKTNGININTQNWFIRKIKKHQIITFTFGFLFFHQFVVILSAYFYDEKLFLESFDFNIWFWVIGFPIAYFLQWLVVILVVSRLPREKLKRKFLKHPIATIILFVLYVISLPHRIIEYGGNIVTMFETIVYYAFISFFWWLLVCWISSKIFKKQRFQWSWYQKIIEKFFIGMPTIYKFILGVLVAISIFAILFILITVVFKYSGQDLKTLFES